MTAPLTLARLTLKAATRHPYWAVGFSGGKDSSVLVDLVARYLLEGCPGSLRGVCPSVLVIYSDTLLEPPPLRAYARGVVEALNRLGGLEGIPLAAVAAEPAPGEDLVGMIAKGYTAPSNRFRWCTKRWKLNPARRAIREWLGRKPLNGELAVLTGVRAEESTLRASRARGPRAAHGGSCPVGSCFRVDWGVGYAPLQAWSHVDVWEYIKTNNPAWGEPSWRVLESIYGAVGSLVNLRMGCWACTLIKRDKAWPALEAAGLIPKGSTQALRGWVDLWLHMSRRDPASYRLRGGRYGYGKLRAEARQRLLTALQELLDTPGGVIIEPLVERLQRELRQKQTVRPLH